MIILDGLSLIAFVQGDVQMCTLLSLIAGEELKVSRSRLVRFLESYIGKLRISQLVVSPDRLSTDILARLRLHSCAAYLRKFSPAEDVRTTTQVCETYHRLYLLLTDRRVSRWRPRYIHHVGVAVNPSFSPLRVLC